MELHRTAVEQARQWFESISQPNVQTQETQEYVSSHQYALAISDNVISRIIAFIDLLATGC